MSCLLTTNRTVVVSLLACTVAPMTKFILQRSICRHPWTPQSASLVPPVTITLRDLCFSSSPYFETSSQRKAIHPNNALQLAAKKSTSAHLPTRIAHPSSAYLSVPRLATYAQLGTLATIVNAPAYATHLSSLSFTPAPQNGLRS
jgi:hypothetical protein